MENYNEKRNLLIERISQYTKGDIAVAFSGGADSSLLLKLASDCAKENGTKVHAMTIQTELHTLNDLDNAKKVAKETNACHAILYIDELKEAEIEWNPLDRCYLCKKLLFSKVKLRAEQLSVCIILEGTNADDLKEYRPGLKAIHELGIKSPLADAGLTKEDVRRMAREYGISAATRPANPCMATRFPYGTRLTKEAMGKAEAAEAFIRGKGFYNVRVRVHDDTARVEVDEKDVQVLFEIRTEIVDYLKRLGYRYITLDLEGFRSGSMDLVHQIGGDNDHCRSK